MEEWRDIKGYEGIYQVSSFGRVRSLDRPGATIINRWGAVIPTTRRGRILKPWTTNSGYLMVSLGKGNKHYIHRLVAEAFCEGCAQGLEVDHINSITTDNRAVNLRWVTKKTNNNTFHHVQGIKNAKSYKVVQLDSDKVIATYPSIIAASKSTGICKSTIARCVSGLYKQAGGYNWKRL